MRDKAIIGISVFGSKVKERVSAGAEGYCEIKSEGPADRERKG